jgi:hypothetical protein
LCSALVVKQFEHGAKARTLHLWIDGPASISAPLLAFNVTSRSIPCMSHNLVGYDAS